MAGSPSITPFALRCLVHGADLGSIEAFIAKMEAEGAGAGRELRERLNKARAAINDTGSFLRHIEWIILRKAWIEDAERGAPARTIARRSLQNLALGRSEGARENQRRALERHEQWRRIAREIAGTRNRQFAGYSLSDIIAYIRKQPCGRMRSGKPYSSRTIYDVLHSR